MVYDKQCEDGRAPYLARLIQSTGQAAHFRRTVWDCLHAAPAAPWVDRVQMFELLLLLCAADQAAIDSLQHLALTTEDDTFGQNCIGSLIRLRGFGTFLAAIQKFGRSVNGDDWFFAHVRFALHDHLGEEAAEAALREARLSCAELDRLMAQWDAGERVSAAEQTTKTEPYAALQLALSEGRGLPSQWRHASQADLQQAARDLLAETDIVRIRTYLRAFARHDFPDDVAPLVPLLHAESRQIAYNTVAVLARLERPEVRTIGLDLFAAGKPALAIRVLRNSAEARDLPRLTSYLEACAADEDAYHDIGSSMMDIAERLLSGSAEKAKVLLHIYENGRCSICRSHAVHRLAVLKQLPPCLLHEGEFDAYLGVAEECREYASTYMGVETQ